MELLSLVLTLKPLTTPAPDKPLPRWWGRAAHSLLLTVVRQYAPELARSLHSQPGSPAGAGPKRAAANHQIRPFTASTLMGRFPAGGFDPQGHYTLRLTAIEEQLAGILWQAARDGPLAVGRTVELDHHKFEVLALAPAADGADSHGADNPSPPPEGQHTAWAARTTYQQLSAPYLLAQQTAGRRIRLQFTSPVTFKTGGKHQPLPLPELVFGSLLTRWNAYAPLVFPPEARRYAAECLAVSAFKLSSRRVDAKSRGLRLGAVGQVTYTSLNYDRYWMSVMHTLAAFARFSGVGAGASMGLGQCRAVDSP